MALPPYDGVLLVSFGGPEAPDEVLPFLRRVTAGRGIPDERLAEVGEHYQRFGGVSPINAQNRSLQRAIADLVELPVFWGNRNSAPFLPDAVAQMHAAGVRRVLAFVTSAYGSYSGCRQYREDIAAARAQVPGAPTIDKLRAFYNHPLFVRAFAGAVTAALDRLPAQHRAAAPVLFTAHSIPQSMADTSPYVPQLREAARLVLAEAGESARPWDLVWQSRSGPPQVPWLEPDIEGALRDRGARGARAAVIAPIGFVSDHMEVVYDLDTVAAPAGRGIGLAIERAATPGDALAPLAAALVAEHRGPGCRRAALGTRGPAHEGCPVGCCPAPVRPGRPAPH